jgi:hypothetical protein
VWCWQAVTLRAAGGLEWLGAASFVYGPAATGNAQETRRRSWSGSVELARARPKAVWQVLWRDRGTPLAAPMPALSACQRAPILRTHSQHHTRPPSTAPCDLTAGLYFTSIHTPSTTPTPRSHGPDQEGESARYPAGPFLLAACTCWTRKLSTPQRMEALRVEADESGAKAEEYKAKVKQLEGETTQKEQEITSLSHKNSVLEGEVEKLEAQVKQFKDEAGAGAQAGTQAESLQRKIQVLEEEAEESDRTIRELNEK